LQILLPSLRGAKLYYSTIIGLNLWQTPRQDRRGSGTLREPKYASQAILSCGAAKLAVEEANFATLSLCGHASLSLSCRSRIGSAPGSVMIIGDGEMFIAP
jgi:hypothetical protein